ncbi:hypothetical protein NQ317_002537 [Molorchus minor]|uniref:Tyr recombinase domain-containing protein n=1 Tax=Molorchus minor TaxID=1323400 RepID=A0ABQ9JDP7_9CUCU|nr:hypothetical protein NQ317_002537 [Molorchus minor]
MLRGNLNKTLAETLTELPVSSQIFGDNLDDRIKAAKALDKTAEELRAKPVSVVSAVSITINNTTIVVFTTKTVTFMFQLQSSSVAFPYHGGRNYIRDAFIQQGLPASAIDIMMSSISPTTLRQYDITWEKWWVYCISCGRNSLMLSHSLIVDFLSIALSPDLGQHPIINKFCKRVYNMRPSAPRYASSWDPSNILTYLSSLAPNEEISLKQLSIKLITLLALVTAHRMQTFFLIQVQNVVCKSSSMEIKVPSHIKTSGKGRLQPVLVLPYFQQNPSICAASTRSCYLSRTAELRSCDRLFIPFKRPHNPVSSQTLGRWVKMVLNASGIDTTQFSTHSTRHATTFAAYRAGVSLDPKYSRVDL